MAQTFVQYVADGTIRDFAVPFDYISTDFVKVFLDDVETAGFTFADTGTVRLDTAPAAGTVVKVQRATPRDYKLVDFVDGSVLKESDLDLANTQIIHVVQEAYDNLGAEARDAIAQDKLDTEGFRDDAREWATRATDSQYTDSDGNTGFSAKHWRDKAQAEKDAATIIKNDTQAIRDAANAEVTAIKDQAVADTTAIRDDAVAQTSAIQSATQAILDDFEGRYYGPLASQPSTDPNGNPPDTGDLYFDTTAGAMRVYRSGSWVDAGTAQEKYFYFTATAGQTAFSGADENGLTLTYTVGAVVVFVNGVRIRPADFTATDGQTITLAEACVAGDEVDVIAFGAFNVADTYTRAEVDAKDASKLDLTGGTLTGPLILAGNPSSALHAVPKQYVDEFIGWSLNRQPSGDGAISGNTWVEPGMSNGDSPWTFLEGGVTQSSNATVVVPVTGWYHIDAAVQFNTTGGTYVLIEVNSTSAAMGYATGPVANVGKVIWIQAGWPVSYKVYSASSNPLIQGSRHFVFFSGHLVRRA